MPLRQTALSIALFLSFATSVPAAEPSPRLAPLKAMLGKTWKAALPGAASEKPKFDVQRWELALNGQAVRILHSINDGDYGGEAIFTFDAEKKAIVYTYVTTGGFYTTGTVEAEAGGFKSHEVVHGSATGPSEVEATSRILPDGRLHVKSRYLKDGKWADGHEIFYSVDAKAVVKFKD